MHIGHRLLLYVAGDDSMLNVNLVAVVGNNLFLKVMRPLQIGLTNLVSSPRF
jgi:hypothetical protein